MNRFPKTILTLLYLSLISCAAFTIDPVINQYNRSAYNIRLGMTISEVLRILPDQSKLGSYGRTPSFFKDGNNDISIYYYRTGRISDDMTTDDEFTPYIFVNGGLSSIGWEALGGPRTYGNPNAQAEFQRNMNQLSNSLNCLEGNFLCQPN